MPEAADNQRPRIVSTRTGQTRPGQSRPGQSNAGHAHRDGPAPDESVPDASAPDEFAAAELGALLDLAVHTAHAAGAMVVTRHAPGTGDAPIDVVETKSSPTDVVTAMDAASERLIRAALLAARPHDGFLGEEDGGVEGTSGITWVVDPVDGTVNYLYDLPYYAVSIAGVYGGDPIVGVVHNPASGDTWTAVRGGGAFHNGSPIQVSDKSDLATALVGTGFGYLSERRRAQAVVAAALLPDVRDIRRFGASALDLCAVAAGRLDAYYEQGLKPWDLAAGGLIVREAGGVVAGAYGAAAGSHLVIAAPPALFTALHDRVAPLANDVIPPGDPDAAR